MIFRPRQILIHVATSMLTASLHALNARRAAIPVWVLVVFAVGTTFPTVGAAGASTDTQDCLSAIFSAAGKFAQCQYKVEAKYFKSLDPSKQVIDRSKCTAKLDASVAKAYEKYGTACPDRSTTTQAAPQQASTLVEDDVTSSMGWTAWQLVSVVSDPLAIYQPDEPSTWPLGSHDDSPRIIVRPASDVRTTEHGGKAKFAVVLGTPPGGSVGSLQARTGPSSVTIHLTSGDPTEAEVSTPTLTFTSDNWNAEQTFEVIGVADSLPDGDIVANITLSVGSVSNAPDYDLARPVADVGVMNLDSDAPHITVTPNQAPMTTTEAGGTATFTVGLDFEPTSPVTIAPTSSNPAEGTVSPASLTFNPSGPGLWSNPQTVTITGTDDSLADGDRAYTIVLAPASSADPGYAGLKADDVQVTNVDNDLPGIAVFPQAGLVTNEAGGFATFQVVLNTQPTASVTMALLSSNTAEGTVSPGSLTFNAGNWNVPQTATVTGVDDLANDGDVIVTILVAPATSHDPAYVGRDAPDVTAMNTDDDSAACGTASKCIFLTSAISTGDLGGLAGADSTCNSLAGSAGLPGTYVAWLSTSSIHAIDRINSNGPYAKTSGEIVANSLAELTDGSLDFPIDEDEYGTVVPLQEAWTGTGSTGLSSGATCADWTDGTASQLGTVGQNEATSSSWTDVFLQFCDHTVSLYCIQQ